MKYWSLLLLLILTTANAAPSTRPVPDIFNYVIGTQTVGPSYHFSNDTPLVETAAAIRDMGSNAIKFALTPNYHGRYTNAPARSDIHSLTDLARLEPSHRKVLDMPFAYYFFWAHSFAEPMWHNGLSDRERDAEYREVYDFAAWLLRTYNGSSKTFFIGHWEGDWMLRGKWKKDSTPSETEIQGMIDWLNIRQKAIDDAKRDIPHDSVQLYHYTEVNLVRIGMEGKPCVTTSVLPKTNVDYVSYSCYDTEADPKQLKASLEFIEAHLPAKSSITAKRVFIGEYGFAAMRFGADKQDELSRQLMRAGLEWGCPFILYWEMYNNEVTDDGKQRGFWLIDDHNAKQPIYFTHQKFYERSRSFVKEFVERNGRKPMPEEFSKEAIRFLER